LGAAAGVEPRKIRPSKASRGAYFRDRPLLGLL
jgi:hypothetical protein